MDRADYAEILVVGDNVSLVEDAYTDYGLSLYIRVSTGGAEKRLLFDVSGSPWMLLHNARLLGIDVTDVDYVVISHMHRDHYAALAPLATLLNPRRVYLPEPRGVSQRVSEVLEGVRVEKTVYVRRRVVIAPGVTLIGPVASSGEVSVLVEAAGLRILLIACGHAPVKQVVYWAGGGRFDVIAGGFHLKNATRGYIEELASLLYEKAGITIGLHCSHWGSGLLKMLLGTRYIDGGVGLRIVADRLGLQIYPQQSL